jgi:GNAT superfamily N-acetyltransferase
MNGERLPMITFSPADRHKPGTIARLLFGSYKDLLSPEAEYSAQLRVDFLNFSTETYENLESIGACLFMTCLNGHVIGFGSYDPRKRPDCGIVGHNCILPEYQSLGYGRRQLHEILRRLKQLEIRRAVVTTSEHPFFLPARSLYLACGFQEVRRSPGGFDPHYKLIDYEKALDAGAEVLNGHGTLKAGLD